VTTIFVSLTAAFFLVRAFGAAAKKIGKLCAVGHQTAGQIG